MKPDVARSSARVRVGSFELDLHSGELRSALGDKVVLREQPFQVLRMLVERDGKMVTRKAIKERLWPNDTIVDFDHSINVAIGVLRRAFEDSAAAPRYIETLARRGYRLLAAIEWLESGPPAVPPESCGTAAASPAPPDLPPPNSRCRKEVPAASTRAPTSWPTAPARTLPQNTSTTISCVQPFCMFWLGVMGQSDWRHGEIVGLA